MFITGHHLYLTISIIGYAISLIFFITKNDRMAYILLVCGFILNALYLLGRGWLGGVFIANSVVEGPFFLPLCMGIIAIAQKLIHKDRRWGVLLIPIMAFSCFALIHPKGMIPPTPQKISLWAICFFVAEIMAHALFYTGAIYAMLSLLKRETGITFDKCIIWGFVMYSIAQVSGAVWSFLGWGNTFNWSSRHLGSAAVWTLYAACLHLKFLPSWTQQKRAVFILFSAVFVLVITTFQYMREMNFPRIGG